MATLLKTQPSWPPTRTVPIVRYEEFLAAPDLHGLLDYTRMQAPNFMPSQVTREDAMGALDDTQRRSLVLFDLGRFDALFRRNLQFFLPHVLFNLDLAPFPVAQLELQMTASSDGGFFRPHTDTGDGVLSTRQLTFVYFFHHEPRRFDGGALRIFAGGDHPDKPEAEAPFELVFPRQNEIVFFPSGLLHEILPVACPSRNFIDSRFTVNGWFRR